MSPLMQKCLYLQPCSHSPEQVSSHELLHVSSQMLTPTSGSSWRLKYWFDESTVFELSTVADAGSSNLVSNAATLISLRSGALTVTAVVSKLLVSNPLEAKNALVSSGAAAGASLGAGGAADTSLGAGAAAGTSLGAGAAAGTSLGPATTAGLASGGCKARTWAKDSGAGFMSIWAVPISASFCWTPLLFEADERVMKPIRAMTFAM